MTNSEKKDLYEHVPHKGKHFEENGRLYYWNFSQAKVGTVVKRKDRAWRQTADPSKGEPTGNMLNLGGEPVPEIAIYIFGFYFDIDTHVECVNAAQTKEDRITKWLVVESGEWQQSLAYAVSSREQYEAEKAKILASW
jgi:hypothetical protein